jgi:hypothetical protein
MIDKAGFLETKISTAPRIRRRFSGIYSFHLVFGKTVQIRHYPVTVSVESLASGMKATGAKVLGRLPKLNEAQVRRPAR